MSSRSDPLDAALAGRFADIALGHVTQEYPHKLDHVLAADEDALPPRVLHPIFFGSFDWHSCVHGYWLLATLRRLHPAMPQAARIEALFDDAFTSAKVGQEVAYLARPQSRGFERPYGWGWLLMLQAELMRHPDRPWSTTLTPLADAFAARFMEFLPRAGYPIRAGTHGNTAFALALATEYAQDAGAADLLELIEARARDWYLPDRDCPAWEPSGDDFLSPALAEAECLRRLLPPGEFRDWFAAFLPAAGNQAPTTLFTPATVSDRSDGKIVHLDGLNLSRAWCWRGIASSLAADDPVREIALRATEDHLSASLAHVSGDYMGEHWLATFALLALSAGGELSPGAPGG